MIIPNFKCRQDDEFVYIEIRAPNARLQNAEFDLSENVVIFTSPPYHLRINLPGSVEATEETNCEWKIDTNEFVLKVKKSIPNDYFEGLDLISRLLTIPKEDELKKRNLIEVVGEESNNSGEVNDDIFDENFEINSFQQTRSILETTHRYGFLNSYSNLIEKYQDELWQLTDLKNPGELTIEQRREMRIKKECDDFNEDHYLYDQFENNEFIDNLRFMKSSWLETLSECNQSSSNSHQSDESNHDSVESKNGLSSVKFTEDEIFRLKNLPKKVFKLSKEEKVIVLYGLVDILFAYCYDMRINEGEQSAESAWNISKISSTLSCFETFWQVDDLLNACLRRSLCYPLYRNYELSKCVLDDVIKVLSNGRVCVIKCLLEIQQLFNKYGEFKYLLNDLYVNDYIVAIQYLDEKYLNRLIELLKSKTIDKSKLDLDLVLLDKAAESIILEQTTIEDRCIKDALEIEFVIKFFSEKYISMSQL